MFRGGVCVELGFSVVIALASDGIESVTCRLISLKGVI